LVQKVRKKRNHKHYKIQNHPVLCKQVEWAVQKSGACTKYLTFKIKEINFGKRFCKKRGAKKAHVNLDLFQFEIVLGKCIVKGVFHSFDKKSIKRNQTQYKIKN